MQKGQIPSAFVPTFFVAALLSNDLVSSQGTRDMTRFLNTSEPIWTYKTTTTRRGYDCNVDVIDNINDNYVLFRRFLGYRKVIISDFQQFLEGRLWYSRSPHDPKSQVYDALNVSFRGATPSSREILLYQRADNECGVVAVYDLVNGGAEPTYELRVKNSSIEVAEQDGCLDAYQKIVKGKPSKVSYVPSCQDILIGKDNILPGGGSLGGIARSSSMEDTRSLFSAPMIFFYGPYQAALVLLPLYVA
ncbi:uncharacterized protein LOC142587771 [Dermacentor variabilis]|uniref:uncharacterized protein LOC142587771 n=1 Tax=Dermacentor variabilis TaxID=34621 RepID=UPI003F5B10FB